jgi:uncharacterized Fe-S center protein
VGELGNPYYVQPFFVHDIVRRVKEADGKPFLTDANTHYHVQRSDGYDHIVTAVMNGFNMARFIVADGLKGENYRGVCSNAYPTGAIKLIHQENLCKALASEEYGPLSTFKKNKVSYVSSPKTLRSTVTACPILPKS